MDLGSRLIYPDVLGAKYPQLPPPLLIHQLGLSNNHPGDVDEGEELLPARDTSGGGCQPAGRAFLVHFNGSLFSQFRCPAAWAGPQFYHSLSDSNCASSHFLECTHFFFKKISQATSVSLVLNVCSSAFLTIPYHWLLVSRSEDCVFQPMCVFLRLFCPKGTAGHRVVGRPPSQRPHGKHFCWCLFSDSRALASRLPKHQKVFIQEVAKVPFGKVSKFTWLRRY